MSDQQSQTTATVVQETRTSACPHPEAVGTRWGDPISEERQGELLGILTAWDASDADTNERKGPFDKRPGEILGFELSGADVFWLAERVRDAQDFVHDLHLEGADLRNAHLEDAVLTFAHLEGAILNYAHLEKAKISYAKLDGAYLLTFA